MYRWGGGGGNGDRTFATMKPLLRKTETSPTLCHKALVYVGLKPLWSEEFSVYLKPKRQRKTHETFLTNEISNDRLRQHQYFFGQFEFVYGEPDTAFMEDKGYFDQAVTLSLMSTNLMIIFPIKSIDFIYRTDFMLEPVINTKQILVDLLQDNHIRHGEDALWAGDVDSQYESYSSLKYAGLIDTDVAEKEAHKVVGQDGFKQLLDDIYKNSTYSEKHFAHGIMALKHSQPYVMQNAIDQKISDMHSIIGVFKGDKNLPKNMVKHMKNTLKQLQRISYEWDDLVTGWKVAFVSHCQMQLELGEKWEEKIYQKKLKETQDKMRELRSSAKKIMKETTEKNLEIEKMARGINKIEE